VTLVSHVLVYMSMCSSGAPTVPPSEYSLDCCRAQVLRLLKREDEAMNDLNKAIELSGGKGKVAENVCVKRPRNTERIGRAISRISGVIARLRGFFFYGLLHRCRHASIAEMSALRCEDATFTVAPSICNNACVAV
jgi:hypothetical protein